MTKNIYRRTYIRLYEIFGKFYKTHQDKWAQNMLNFELWLLRKKYMKGRKEYSINR